MSRIPYDIVSIQANILIINMALSCSNYYWQLYIAYIEACGWSDQEYDIETLHRIDAAWDNEQQVWN